MQSFSKEPINSDNDPAPFTSMDEHYGCSGVRKNPNNHDISVVYLPGSVIQQSIKNIFYPNENNENYSVDKNKYCFRDMLIQNNHDEVCRGWLTGAMLFCIDKVNDFEALLLPPMKQEVETIHKYLKEPLIAVFDPLKSDAEQICNKARELGFTPIPMFSDKTKNEFLKAVTNYAKNAEAYCTAWINDDEMKAYGEKLKTLLNASESTGLPLEINALISTHVKNQVAGMFFQPTFVKKDEEAVKSVGKNAGATTAAATIAPVLKK